SNKPEVKLLSASKGGVTISATLSGLENKLLPAAVTGAKEELFAELTIPGFAYTGELGKPKLPMITAVLDVPIGAGVSVNVTNGNYREYKLAALGVDQRIVPALPSVPKIEGAKAQFVYDAATYAADAMYPGTLADVSDGSREGGLARGHRLVTIQLYPVQYNPATGTLRVYSDIKADVRFSGGDYAKSARLVRQDYSRDWESLIQRMALNYDASLYGAKDSLINLPIYYDIFYGPSFAAAAQRLADWKTQKGYKVRINGAGGWTAAQINDSIRLRSPKATYVAVIGDPNATGSDALPPSATVASPGSGDQTDLYYAETDESGYLPDLFNARLSVKTAADADIVINKLINYEKANFGSAGTAWLKKATLISGYDATYQPVGIATNEYCRQILAREGYTTVDTLIIGSSESGATARVMSKVNAGRAWTIYTAHGSRTAWTMGPSNITISDLAALTNLDMYTMPAGHCCLANDWQYSSDCFGESWPRQSNKAGVSYYGSVPSTYWDEDDWLQRRYFDALYDSVPGTPGYKMDEIGRATTWAMYWLQNNTTTTRKQYYFEAYHVMNDASMDFWTDAPHTLTVAHAPGVAPNSGNFAVNVKEGGTNIAGALVCGWVKNRAGQQWSAYTDAGGNINLPVMPTTLGDTMLMTVTRHNFDPYEGYAIVRAGYPYVVHLRHGVSDAASNNDGIVNPGESIVMPTWVKNVGTDPTSGALTGTLRTASPWVTFSDSAHDFGVLAAGDSAQYAVGYKFAVSASCTNAVTIPFDLVCHDDDSTWVSTFSVTVGTAVLAYNGRTIAGNGRLDPNQSEQMAVSLKNNGLGNGYNTRAILRCADGRINVNDSTATYGTVNAGATAASGAESFAMTSGAIPAGTAVAFTLVMKADGVADRSYGWSETVGDLRYAPTPDNTAGTPLYYAVEDSDGVSRAPAYQWAEIREIGTALPSLLADDTIKIIPLPFTFKWYGTGYTTLSACSNGWISFDSNNAKDYKNTTIPTTAFASPTVFALWDDLNGLSANAPNAWVGYYDDTANHRFILEYDSLVFLGTSTRLKFQVIYYDSTANHPYYDVDIQYAMASPGTSSSAGFQKDETTGSQLLFDGTYAATMLPLGNNRAIRLTRSLEPVVPPAPVPVNTMLEQNWPNPFTDQTHIRFGLPRDARIELSVYNILGQKVAKLADGALPAGYHTANWNGRTAGGQRASGGVYFYRLTTPDHRVTKRLVYIR
ncbi:MAG: C25 family cysteine peptidase, partial [Candidatus Edwardsbacteria bacterium]|nr:C25 family cysteine peptidase [Candidatus Edwardsbacteria bacterium]